jgi:FixJ family two-component response regulator
VSVVHGATACRGHAPAGGCAAYFGKRDAGREVLDAIQSAFDRPLADLLQAVDRALQRDARQRAQRRDRQALRGRFDALTLREHEVLKQVMQGKLNKQIASALGIGERTVKLHRSTITRKLQVRSVAELTRLVQEAGVFG